MDKYTEMLVFSKAADLGSFSAAARELDLTPSAVSKLITRLEDRLGARLFQRTTRKLSLTAEGNAFNERCGSILDEIRQAEDAVMALHDRVSGTLRVTTISAFAHSQLPDAFFHQSLQRLGIQHTGWCACATCQR